MRRMLYFFLTFLLIYSCRDSEIDPLANGMPCIDEKMDHIYLNGECTCPEENYQLGYQKYLESINEPSSRPLHWICKKNLKYTYLLVHDCPCLGIAPVGDSAIVQFYHEDVAELNWDSSRIHRGIWSFFPQMGTIDYPFLYDPILRNDFYYGHYSPAPDGDEWSIESVAEYFSDLQTTNCYKTFYLGTARGKFNPENTYSKAMITWNHTDYYTDTCWIELFKKQE